ncbi:GNAT family N-acetyltransferase [Planctomycetota bacterium]
MYIYIEKSAAVEIDARLVMAWRNDPSTLEASFHQKPKKWDTYWPEFRDTYFQYPDMKPVFACHQGKRVAFLRFQPYHEENFGAGWIDIGINVDPACRQRGLGSAILAKITERMLDTGIAGIVAEIKPDTIASIRAFENAGYRYFDQYTKVIDDTGESIPVFRFTARNPKAIGETQSKHVFIIAEPKPLWRHAGSTLQQGRARSSSRLTALIHYM